METPTLVFKNQEHFDKLKESPSYINELYDETKKEKFTELEFCGFLIHGNCSDHFNHYDELSPFIIGELYYRQPSLKDKLDLSKLESKTILNLILKDERNIDILNLYNLTPAHLGLLILQLENISVLDGKVDFTILTLDEYEVLLEYRPHFINIYKKSKNFDRGTYRYFLTKFPKCRVFERGV